MTYNESFPEGQDQPTHRRIMSEVAKTIGVNEDTAKITATYLVGMTFLNSYEKHLTEMLGGNQVLSFGTVAVLGGIGMSMTSKYFKAR